MDKMKPDEAIDTLRIMEAAVEWDYPMDYAVAIDMAVEALEKQIEEDDTWQFVKYKGDIATYAKCNCGFHYACYKYHSINQPFPTKPDPEKLYKYCPLCGSRKTKYIDEIINIDKYSWED